MGVPVAPGIVDQLRSKLQSEEPQYLSPWQEDPLVTMWGRQQRHQLFARACATIPDTDLARRYIALRKITKALVLAEDAP